MKRVLLAGVMLSVGACSRRPAVSKPSMNAPHGDVASMGSASGTPSSAPPLASSGPLAAAPSATAETPPTFAGPNEIAAAIDASNRFGVDLFARVSTGKTNAVVFDATGTILFLGKVGDPTAP